LGRPHAGREHWERLVIAEAARIDLARAAASWHATDATVTDGRRQIGWRFFDGRR
jgi:hypothetical protein